MDPTEEVARSRYALLTTYRRDGRPVATPVWIVMLDGGLGVWSAPSAGKVKRVRGNPAVTVAVCDSRGGSTGSSHAGRAELLDPAGVRSVLRAIRRKYWLQGPAVMLLSRLRGRLGHAAAIRITLDRPGKPGQQQVAVTT